jgi:hypothetical protein
MKHDKRLVRDEDYIVIDESPAYMRAPGEDNIRRSRSAIKVYAPAISDEELFLCRTCEAFTSTAVQGIHAHQQTHLNARKKEQAMADGTSLRSIAFGLLPPKIQTKLLAEARKIVGAP